METLITQTTFISTNGIRLHAELAGPEDGPLVVLLHGFPEFWWGWHHQINALAQAGFRVVVPDQRGYNLSDRPKSVSDYQIDHLARDITGIITAMGREQAVIAGHDWGAAVAWHLGITYPERVRQLIIVNVPHQAVINHAMRKPIWKQVRKSWYIFFFQIPRLPEWLLSLNQYAILRRTFLLNARPGTFSSQDFDRYRETWRLAGGLTAGIHWYRAMARLGLKMGREDFNRKFTVRVTVPTLVLWGDQDAFLEPSLADGSMEWVDNGHLVHFPDATHWILHEECARVNHHMLEFIAEK